VNPGFCEKMEVTHVPLVVRVPQVGNPCCNINPTSAKQHKFQKVHQK